MNDAPEVEGQSAPRSDPNDARGAGRDDAATHTTTKANSDANGATMNHQSDATGATLWLSVAQAAEAEGVSVRAVQRRCQSGKYRSRRAQTSQGERLEVDAATLTNHATQGRDARDDEGITPATQRRDGRDDEPQQRRDARDAKASDEGAAVPDRRADEEAARLRAEVERERQEREQDREEIRFLRGLVEQRDRDAAELRAALRKALEIAPRQLPSPGPPDTAPKNRYMESPSHSRKEPEPKQQAQKNAAPKKEPRPLWKLVLGIK